MSFGRFYSLVVVDRGLHLVRHFLFLHHFDVICYRSDVREHRIYLPIRKRKSQPIKLQHLG